jgi:hypothetical protein
VKERDRGVKEDKDRLKTVTTEQEKSVRIKEKTQKEGDRNKENNEVLAK